MAANTASANNILRGIFHGDSIAGVSQNASSSPATDAEISLHTADQGAGGSQSTNLAAYSGYSHALVPREAGGWNVVANAMSPAAVIPFPVCTAGVTVTYTHVGIKVGVLFFRAALAAPLDVFAGITPKIPVDGFTLTIPTVEA